MKFLLALFLLTSTCVTALATYDKPIVRVEKGLLPPARLAGSKDEPWTLADRMAYHGVGAVSIAVIDHDVIEEEICYVSAIAGAPKALVTPATRLPAGALADPVLAASKFAPAATAEPAALLHALGMNDSEFAPGPTGTALLTTPGDLARFVLGLLHAFDGRPSPFPRDAVANFLTPKESAPAADAVLDFQGTGRNYSFRRSDRGTGSCSFLVAFPHLGQGAVVMTNSGDGVALAGEILRAIAREYGWPDYQIVEKTAVALPPGAFDDFAGFYSRDDTVIRISEDDGHFFLKLRGEPRREIFPLSDHEFFLLDEPEILSFERNSAGFVTHFIRRAKPAQIFLRTR